MREDLFQRVLPQIFKDQNIGGFPGHIRGPDQQHRDNQIKSGTTVLFFHFVDGLMFAGDRKEVMGTYTIRSQDVVKIHQIGPFIAFAFAGLVSDGQFIQNKLEQINSGFQRAYGYPLSVKGQAQYIRNYLFQYCHYFDPRGMYLDVLLGGRNLLDDKYEAYEITGDGCLEQLEYAATGSGWSGATHVLDENRNALKKHSLSCDDASLLAVKAIFRAGQVDTGTSPLQVALPTVAVITKNGFQFVEESKIIEIRDFLLNMEKRNG